LITSYGVVAFRWNPIIGQLQYLMICRKNTLGFMDFLRGKYAPSNEEYILNMMYQMTEDEKKVLLSGDFDVVWRYAFNDPDDDTFSGIDCLKHEMSISRDKYRYLSNTVNQQYGTSILTSLIQRSCCKEQTVWTDPEWGFPKGRRNYRESDYDCAIREFCEETGYSNKILRNVQNMVPFEEIFMGSNYKSYKHRYYLVNIMYDDSCAPVTYETAEVSKMEWKTYDECIRDIRPYNLEKKRVITNIHAILRSYTLIRE
jgi:8-oxo-dGTP pyrophosphatase MutT (NUDIX family)